MVLIIGFTCPTTIHFKFITKCDRFFYYKLRKLFYYKVRQVLERVNTVFQSFRSFTQTKRASKHFIDLNKCFHFSTRYPTNDQLVLAFLVNTHGFPIEDAEVLLSTKSKSNFQRLTRLLMRGGAVLLREIFDSIHSPASLPTTLSVPSVERKLRTARLTRPDWNCLFPSPGVYGKSSDFDISLTFRAQLFERRLALTRG